ELGDANLLLHVVDASDPRLEQQIEAVQRILRDLGLEEKQRLLVFNKADRLPKGEAEAIAHQHDGLAISATTREGIEELLHRCDRLLWADGRVAFSDVEAGAPAPAEAPPRLLPSAARRVS
ncbi:MAG TPA: GTPase HflX, partial [Anaeromyxobacteraceae bacterium]|nr:GTPase HflX [Anaeromyxobacteraceae bacterium]